MLERRCALFGCNNSQIGTKITNSEIYKEALKHAQRVQRLRTRRVAFNVASALIVVYLTSLCVNWAFFGTRGARVPKKAQSSLKAPNRLKPLKLA
jgi:hypothetical protein